MQKLKTKDMEPRLKAEELINKFKEKTTYQYQEYAGANYSTFEHDLDTIKDCALVLLDEIIKECIDIKVNYWLTVREEIVNIKN